MNSIVLTVLSMSLSGSILAALLFALSPFLKNRTSKAFQYYIWLPVLLRFVLPVGFSISIPTVSATFNQAGFATVVQYEDSGEHTSSGENFVVSEYNDNGIVGITAEKQNNVTASADTNSFDTTIIITLIWLAGLLVSICWHTTSYNTFKRRVYRSSTKPHTDDIEIFEQQCDDRKVHFIRSKYVDTPMLIGLLETYIIVPDQAYQKNDMQIELENILRHELTHNRRHDLSYKWIVIIMQSIHWFNPFVYLISRKISRACELSCDEAVIHEMSAEQRKSYGNTLLALASPDRLPSGVAATTLCEEKKQLKERLLCIKEHHKRPKSSIALMVVITLLLTGCASVYADFRPEAKAANSINEEVYDGFCYDGNYYTLGTVTETSFPSSQSKPRTVLRSAEDESKYIILPGTYGAWSDVLQRLVYADGKKIRTCDIDGSDRETIFKVPTGKAAQLRVVLDEYAIVRGVVDLRYGATAGEGAFYILNLTSGEVLETEILSV